MAERQSLQTERSPSYHRAGSTNNVGEGSSHFTLRGRRHGMSDMTENGSGDEPDASPSAQAHHEEEERRPRTSSPPLRRHGSNITGRSARVSTTASLPENGESPAAALDAIRQFLDEQHLRLADVFRSTKFNASYADQRDDELDVNEVGELLKQAGLDLPQHDVKAFIRFLDTRGKGTLSLKDLDAGLRDHRRGKQEWSVPEPPQRPAIIQHRASTLTQEKAESEWPVAVLNAVQDLLDSQHMRIGDLFRSALYNPQYAVTQEEVLDTRQLKEVVAKAGGDVPEETVLDAMRFLDTSGSGQLDIDDLSAALRAHRRGQGVSTAEEWAELRGRTSHGRSWSPGARGRAPRSPSGSPRNGNSPSRTAVEHCEGLHRKAEELRRKLQQRRELMEKREHDKILEEKAKAMMGSRKYRARELSPQRVVDRLVEAGHHYEEHIHDLRRKFEDEEAERLQAMRFQNRSPGSSPRVSGGGEDLYARSVAWEKLREEKRQQIQNQIIANETKDLNLVGTNAAKRGASPNWERLWLETQKRTGRRKKMQEEAVHRVRSLADPKPGRKPVDAKRIEDWQKEWAQRQQARLKAQAENQQREIEKIHKEVADIKEQNPTPKALRKVSPRIGSEKELEKRRHRDAPDSPHKGGKKETLPLAFGSCRPRSSKVGADTPHIMVNATDMVLAAINAVVSLRCGCSPEDAPAETLCEVLDPLDKALQAYRDAAEESESQANGTLMLRKTRCERLYSDGTLMEDEKGFAKLSEPDAITQLTEDINELMVTATKAQRLLLRHFGPGVSSRLEDLDKRWPQGARWNNPRGAKQALFAFNPGPKTRAAADTKAFVRFAPATRHQRYRHVLDYARLSLVFANATQLRASLQEIKQHMEVVGIRNFYHPHCQNFLGDRYVEVLVVMKEGLEEPHVCELRLEEECFYRARKDAAPYLDKVFRGFREMYSRTAREEAVEYLASWTLRRPKERPSLARLRRKLAVRYGSAVAAWRRALGGAGTVDFKTFRAVCQNLQCQENVVEFWEGLASGLGNTISMFELDPEAVVLLARFRAALNYFAKSHPDAITEGALFARLTSKFVVPLRTPGKIEESEFRLVCKPLGIGPADADRLFSYLDMRGGSGSTPPATMIASDVSWVKKLPGLVDIEAVMLAADADSCARVERLTQTLGAQVQPRHAGTPAVLRAKLAGKQPRRGSSPSICSSQSQSRLRSPSPKTPLALKLDAKDANSEPASPSPSFFASPSLTLGASQATFLSEDLVATPPVATSPAVRRSQEVKPTAGGWQTKPVALAPAPVSELVPEEEAEAEAEQEAEEEAFEEEEPPPPVAEVEEEGEEEEEAPAEAGEGGEDEGEELIDESF